jgi:hypothetical protein
LLFFCFLLSIGIRSAVGRCFLFFLSSRFDGFGNQLPGVGHRARRSGFRLVESSDRDDHNDNDSYECSAAITPVQSTDGINVTCLRKEILIFCKAYISRSYHKTATFDAVSYDRTEVAMSTPVYSCTQRFRIHSCPSLVLVFTCCI